MALGQVPVYGTKDDFPGPSKDAAPDTSEVEHIPPLAFLRSMWAILWGALRHPFCTTFVDLSTGRAIHVPMSQSDE